MADALSLNEQIDALSTDQAQKAILNFYELLPVDWWTENKKLPIGNIEIRAAVFQKNAPADVQPLVNKLTSQGNDELKAAMARALLFQFAQNDRLVSYVEQAVTRAREPQMLPIPIFIGAFLVVLAIIPTSISVEKDKVHIEFGNLKEVASLAASLKDIMDKFDIGNYLK